MGETGFFSFLPPPPPKPKKQTKKTQAILSLHNLWSEQSLKAKVAPDEFDEAGLRSAVDSIETKYMAFSKEWLADIRLLK